MNIDGRGGAEVIAFLGELRSGSSYLPNDLIAVLSVWCLALIAVLVIAPTEYKGIAPLLVERLPGKQDDATGEEMRSVAVRVSGMEERGAVREPDNSWQTSTVQKRIAANILVRSGYLHSASLVTHRDSNPPWSEYKVTLDEAAANCARLAPPDDTADLGNVGIGPHALRALLVKTEALVAQAPQRDPKSGEIGDQPSDIDARAKKEETEQAHQEMRDKASHLAITAVAVEKFHRNSLQRKFEWLYARAFLALFGTLPDISLGPAQIRVSRFREVVAELREPEPPDAEAADLLMDECQSLQLAAILMRQFLVKATKTVEHCAAGAESENCPSEEEVAAAAYVGQRRRTHAIVDYGPIVAHMVNMID